MHIDRRLVIGPAALAGAALAVVLASAQSPAFTTITGEIGPGSLYEIAMPTAPWNGELVLFAHGIGNPASPVALPALGPLKDTLAAGGFAIAYSSFSVNGYGGLKDGMQRTHQLRGVFTAIVGEPARVYLVGRSLGGLIVTGLVERFPSQYAGALANCGLLGGGAAELQYLADARVLFDYFFPGIVPLGTDLGVPPGIDFSPGGPTYTAVRNALIQGLSSPGQPTLQFARAAKLPGAGATEIVQAAMNVIGFTLIQGNDLMAVTHSHMPYDNIAAVYEGSDDDDALNAGVARFAADPSAAVYMDHHYTPSGDLLRPVLTVHTTRDPIAPIFHEAMYAAAVESRGASPFLLQRTVTGFGHCGAVAAGAETAAFFDLVEWVRTGVKPQS